MQGTPTSESTSCFYISGRRRRIKHLPACLSAFNLLPYIHKETETAKQIYRVSTQITFLPEADFMQQALNMYSFLLLKPSRVL
jgi:hypothetical protein